MKLPTTLLSALAAAALVVPAAHAQQQERQPADDTQQEKQPAGDTKAQQPDRSGQQHAKSEDASLVIRPEALSQNVRMQMQRKLEKAGHYKGDIDGQFGKNTRQALEKFQRAQGIEPTGELDIATLQALDANVFTDTLPRAETGAANGGEEAMKKPAANGGEEAMKKPAANGGEEAMKKPAANGGEEAMHQRDTIRAVQRELEKRGMYEGDIDGLLGPKTKEAVRHFQSANDLEVTGSLDDKTMSALGVEPQKPEKQKQEKQEKQGTKAKSGDEAGQAR